MIKRRTLFVFHALPYFCAQIRRAPHSCIGPDPKSVIELLQIHGRTDSPELARAVWIDRDQASQFGLFAVGSPDLGKRQKETLLGSQSVDVLAFGRIFNQGPLKRFVSDAGPAQVGDVLA